MVSSALRPCRMRAGSASTRVDLRTTRLRVQARRPMWPAPEGGTASGASAKVLPGRVIPRRR
jgi:hypothetical protein